MNLLDVAKAQEALSVRFFSYFKEKGFSRGPTEPLIPLIDRSLLFTNATIVPVKPYLMGDMTLPPGGLVLKQTCLRTQNLAIPPKTLEYLSLFSMLGVIAQPVLGPDMLNLALHYLTSVEGIDRDRICIRHTDGTDLLSTKAMSLGLVRREINSRPANFYHWKYGLPEITGTGITFALRSWDGSFYDIGNLVEIRDSNQILGYEFGFGIETFLARKAGVFAPLQFSLLKSPISNDGPRDQISRDYLATCLAIIEAGVRPGSGRQSSILRKALRRCVCHFQDMKTPGSDVRTWILEYGAYAGYTRRAAEELQRYLFLYQERLEKSVF